MVRRSVWTSGPLTETPIRSRRDCSWVCVAAMFVELLMVIIFQLAQIALPPHGLELRKLPLLSIPCHDSPFSSPGRTCRHLNVNIATYRFGVGAHLVRRIGQFLRLL